MADKTPQERSILDDLAQIAAGFGVLAAAAVAVMAGQKRGARSDQRLGVNSLNELLRSRPSPRRKPPESGVAVPAVPPRGPVPLQDGAAAPLNFEHD